MTYNLCWDKCIFLSRIFESFALSYIKRVLKLPVTHIFLLKLSNKVLCPRKSKSLKSSIKTAREIKLLCNFEPVQKFAFTLIFISFNVLTVFLWTEKADFHETLFTLLRFWNYLKDEFFLLRTNVYNWVWLLYGNGETAVEFSKRISVVNWIQM